jgi:cysteine desulfurase
LELAQAECSALAPRLRALRDELEAGIAATIPDVRMNAAGAERLAGISSVAFAGAASAALLIRLDLEGIAASAGSACAAGSIEPSHVVAALGLPDRYRDGVIRFSLGQMSGPGEVDRTLAMLPRLVAQVRGAAAVV